MRFVRPLVAAFAALLAAAALASPASEISAPLSPEKLALAPDVATHAFDRIEMRRQSGGLWTVSLLPAEPGVAIPPIDLRLLVPRVPALARGNADLTKIALIQREFNRNETHYALADGRDFSIANNCLRQGLWEVKLAESHGGKTVMVYHAWFTFPKGPYGELFQEVNGIPYGSWDAVFSSYPKLAGLPVPLAAVRRVRSETVTPPLELHSADPLQRLPEQTGKMKYVLTPAIATYGDFPAAGRQPVSTAKFSEPGYYNPSDPMKFDLGWLAHPAKTVVRKVVAPSGGAPFMEVEIAFENGNRILFADPRIGSLPARTEAPLGENDVLKIVSGIGTPVIQATSADRTAELSEDRPRYLFLLDRDGALADNHLGGVDGIYLWREAGTPGTLHVWVVGYERIALVAHFSTPWKD
jgi:hypothetical protein